ncbi:hypothetical protein [Streptomyces sp. NPDC059786]|uniref:hypothetical protein n=1 Tax=Streptomyces sp. NPDC059786 TaxID=3346946 RepID=UPI003664923F
MEWTGLLNTALGALIALGASAFVEHRRWSRESTQRANDDRRAVYVAFLDATATASETLINIARAHGDGDGEDVSVRAWTVLRDSSVLSRRLELALVADDRVLAEVGKLVAMLRAYRDVVSEGRYFDTGEFQHARTAFNEQRDRLMRVMRESL